MTRVLSWMMLAVWAAGGLVVAAPVTQVAAPTPATVVKDLARNTALGESLTDLQGTAEEYAVVQKLYDRGLNAARELVATSPKSAEAQYLLGSWLLYGYQVVDTEHVFYDVNGEKRRAQEQAVVKGLTENAAEGLKALEVAHALAPQNGRYFVDYGAALYDCSRLEEAMRALKKAWLGRAKLPPSERMRTALLMSDVLADQGEIVEAREWIYRALSLDPKNQGVTSRLRHLDRMQTEALIPPSPPEIVAPAPPAEEELTPADEGTTEEVAPEEEVSPEAPEEGAGTEESAPAAPEGESGE